MITLPRLESSSQGEHVLSTNSLRPEISQADPIHDDSSSVSTTKNVAFLEIDFLYGRSLAARHLLAEMDPDLANKFWERLRAIEDRGTRFIIRRDFVRRFATESPRKTLSLLLELPWLERQSLIETFFSEVASERISEGFASLSDISVKDQRIALETILYFYSDLTPEQQEELARRYGLSEILSTVRARHLLDLAEDQPERAWSLLDRTAFSPLAYQELTQAIIEHWVDREGATSIEHIAATTSSEDEIEALTIALAHFARSYPEEALKLAQDFSNHDNIFLINAVIRGWAESSPKAIIDYLNASDELHSNNVFYLELLEIWAKLDPRGLYASVDLFPEELRAWVAEQAISNLAPTHPEQAAQLLMNYDNSMPGHTLVEVLDSWLSVDVDSMINWIDEHDQFTESDRHYLLEVILPRLAITDPDRALLMARDKPTGLFEPGLEFDVIESLARQDVQRAKSLLPEVRSGVSKLAAFGAVGYAYIRRGQIDEAFELGSELPEKMRDSYNGGLVGDWSIHDPLGLFLGIDSIPTPHAKSRAAVYLLGAHKETHFLADEEVEYVRTFLSELDASVVDY